MEQIQNFNIRIDKNNLEKWASLDDVKRYIYLKYIESILNLLIANDIPIELKDTQDLTKLTTLITELNNRLDDLYAKIDSLSDMFASSGSTDTSLVKVSMPANSPYAMWYKYKSLYELTVKQNDKLKAFIKELAGIICRNRSCVKPANEKEEIDIEHICNGEYP
jgi:hypothetical protein